MRSAKNGQMEHTLIKLITDLNDRLVVVEGKRDVAALEKIGVRANVITLDRLARVEDIPDAPAVILTDFDRSGEIKHRKAESILYSRGVWIDAAMRERFKRIFGTLTIEDVPHIFRELTKRKGE